jgi:DNA-binding transcriptional LysR family regulator
VTLETLHLYCAIVRLRSFSRGAAANQVSQSAASQAIQQLEADLGVLLIDRSKRPFMVTPEGRSYYEACRTLLRGYEKVKAEITASRTQVSGTVRVAAIYSVGLHDMGRHMQRFMSLHPQAKVRSEYLHPHKVVEAVLNDEADLGIISYPTPSRSLTVLPWRSEPMAFVCYPGHRLARRKLIAATDLDGEEFVAFDPDLAIRKAIDRSLRQQNARPNIVMEFDNIETIKQAIAIRAGVSILPAPAVEREVSGRVLVAIPLAARELVRPLGIIHRRHRRFTPTVARFVDFLRESGAAPARPGPSA